MYELFEQKYKECEKSLFLVAFGYLHNTEDAKDCVQEAVLSALKSFNSLNNKEFFKTWLTRIVINKSKDYLKKQRFTEELTDNLNVFYDMPSDEIGIMDCICKLNPKSSIYIYPSASEVLVCNSSASYDSPVNSFPGAFHFL